MSARTTSAIGGMGLALLVACGAHDEEPTGERDVGSTSALAETPEAASTVASVRARFQLTMRVPAGPRRGPFLRGQPMRVVTRPALADGVATAFVASPGEMAASHVRPVLRGGALAATRTPAVVDLPRAADGAAVIEDPRSGTKVRFALSEATAVQATVAEGHVLYRGALAGADVIHRVLAEGTEDYVSFATRPAREELAYDVDVSAVAGLRLVSDTLEFLDDGGSPTLRIAPPYVVDASGRRHDAHLAVDGCRYDASPAAPWGRPLTPIGASRCTVRVAWSDVAYPALVDPAWTTTGSTVISRMEHRTVVLPSKKVLILGGESYPTKNVTELFDATANGGVGAFAASGTMIALHQSEPYQPSFSATLLANGKVLVAGRGESDPIGPATLSSAAEIYDPATGQFTATGSLLGPRGVHTATLLANGKVLIAGGYTATDYTCSPSNELFDPGANGGVGAFSSTGPLSAGRYYHASTRLQDGRVLISGGYISDQASAKADLFDPSANGGAGAVVSTLTMKVTHTSHEGVLLPSGRVLLVSPSAELFDPTANAGGGGFALTGAMAHTRSNYGVALLPKGRVAVIGGISSFSQGADIASPELTTEIYDETLGHFVCGPAMDAARACFGSSVLSSGSVLVTGGCYDSYWFPGFVNTARIFDPTQGPCESELPTGPGPDAGAGGTSTSDAGGGSSSGGSTGSSSGGEDDAGAGDAGTCCSGSDPGTSSGGDPGTGSSSSSSSGTPGASSSSSGGGTSSGTPASCAASPGRGTSSNAALVLASFGILGLARRRKRA